MIAARSIHTSPFRVGRESTISPLDSLLYIGLTSCASIAERARANSGIDPKGLHLRPTPDLAPEPLFLLLTSPFRNDFLMETFVSVIHCCLTFHNLLLVFLSLLPPLSTILRGVPSPFPATRANTHTTSAACSLRAHVSLGQLGVVSRPALCGVCCTHAHRGGVLLAHTVRRRDTRHFLRFLSRKKRRF